MTKEEVLDSVTMDDVCHRYGISINRAGFAKCPFHRDSKPSMKIYNPNRDGRGHNGYKCFACGAGGSNVFDFVMRYESISFSEAFKSLGGTYGFENAEERERLLQEQRIRDLDREIENDLKTIFKNALMTQRDMRIHYLENKRKNEPYFDENGAVVFPDLYEKTSWDLDRCEMRIEYLEEEGRKNGWL